MMTRRRLPRSSTCCGRVWTKMSRVKKLEEPDENATQLNRCLGTRDAVLLALGAMVGSGGYVLEGVVAKEQAGPIAIVCFFVSGVITMMAAFCFAEFGVLIPRAGSAYVYVYVTLGEFWAFLVGWNILVSCMTATVPLSHTFYGYIDDLVDHGISNGTEQIFGTMDVFIFDKTPNLVAAALCIVMIVIKTGGVHSSSKISNFFTIFNMSVLAFVIVFGLYLADLKNWTDNFVPFGISGFLKGAGTCFFAYPGFEDITFASEEIRNPGRAIPIAVCWCMTLAMVVYMLFAAAITLSVPLSALDAVSAAPSAFAYHGYYWPKYLVSAGAISGTVAAMYGIMYISSRVAYSMAQDGLVFKRMAYVNPKTMAPSTAIIFTGLVSMLMSLLFRTTDMIMLTNAGCLITYIIVSGSLIVIRYDPPTFLTRAQFAINNGGPMRHDSKDTECLWSDELANPPGPCGLCQGFQLLLRPFKRGNVILACLLIIVFATAGMGTVVRIRYDDLVEMHHGVMAIIICLGILIVLATLVICSYEQRPLPCSFHVPGVPILPILSIMCYVVLLLTLDAIAWMLFGVTTLCGLIMYFGYGLWHGSDADIGERFERASLRGEGETRSISVCYD